ncbi:ferrous iron transport protein B [Kosmotoga olearia]|uniref:Ferrous iron transport protein B n=1 Tax=Kosmotoga olearia (strain ATCC BAA-1733 / DSM 21960 / TBF 19.5.1) TaxID=521045 RepID=C5CFL5_KOSOT|nr:ferrous iron transport protein B [Kosmotoga olearia]ACR79433.1 ferrous iron transport protein B [Kosmotoga olearia TBF 19.5.1]
MENIKVALTGNPNVGKTAIFNGLTGMRQHVGNWPGVTVEKKEGTYIHKGINFLVTDLPGIYSLSAVSIDERIARNFLTEENPDVVVAIIDGMNLERNLYLVSELMDLGVNLIIAVNFMDEVEKNDMKIDIQKLSEVFGVPVVGTVAIKGHGIQKLKDEIFKASQSKSVSFIRYSDELEQYIKQIEEISRLFNIKSPFRTRFLALKLIEEDPEIFEQMRLSVNNARQFSRLLNEILSDIKQKHDDPSVFVGDEKFKFIKRTLKNIVEGSGTKSESLTNKMDNIFTHRIWGLPILFGIMYTVFQLTFTLGGIFADWLDSGMGFLSDSVLSSVQNEILASFLANGVIGGVGSVLVFVPNIFILFLLIAVLENVGYMARAAFVMDKVMNAIGLSGKSFIPMILGFGCNVPAIMATRTIEKEDDRIITAVLNPLIPCSARIPIFLAFAGTFFPKHQGLIVFSMYIIAIALIVILAKILKTTLFKGTPAPFVMELPPYRVPSFSQVNSEAWKRTSLFVKKAGTIIFAAVIAIWLLASLPTGVEYASKNSYIGLIGKAIAPIFKPNGFGNWQSSVALIFGFMAKEVVVGTLGALAGGIENLGSFLSNLFTPISAYSFMLFSLLYVPCVASLGILLKEVGMKWTVLSVVLLISLAYFVSMAFYLIGSLFI